MQVVRAVARDVVIGSLAAVLLLAACAIYLTTGGPERPPTDDSERVTLRCTDCGKSAAITRSELDRRTKAREWERTIESKATFYSCGSCGKMKAIVSADAP